MKASLQQLNASDRDAFVAVCGRFFEHSPWIAERTWERRPFSSREELHQAMCQTMRGASRDEQVKLIVSHPDLVGRAARDGTLTHESTQEQSAAGLGALSADEVASFQKYNAAYRERFGFPFVICV